MLLFQDMAVPGPSWGSNREWWRVVMRWRVVLLVEFYWRGQVDLGFLVH